MKVPSPKLVLLLVIWEQRCIPGCEQS
jgi:hypothetical protein